jgi:hypothetical protein
VVEVADVRRRFRARLEEARKRRDDRKAAADRASQEYDVFLRDVATPALQMVASVLSAEGYPFKVFTPAGSVRMASTRSREDYFEVELDSDSMPPQVIGRVNRARGGRLTTLERPIRDAISIPDLTDSDIVDWVLSEIEAFV